MAQGQLVNLGNVMQGWATNIVDSLRKELLEDDTVASRKLLQSIHPKVLIFGDRFEMQILMEDYWESVDKGQKPGTKPDVQKILRWMDNKKIKTPEPLKRFKAVKSFSISGRLKRKLKTKAVKNRRLAVAERIANAIQRKGTIKRFDYGGSGFVTDFTKTLADRMRASIAQATGKDIEIQIKNIVK